MPYNELTYKTLENIKRRIENTMQGKGIDNSGAAQASLEIKENKLLGNDYIYFLDQGRKPGKYPPLQTLRQWVREKLRVDESEVKGIAYLVGRKIASQGTEIFRDKTKGIQLDNIVNEELENLYKELPDYVAAEALKWL